jgi:hypothetical protein
MVDKECNLRAVVYKVQTFGTTHIMQIYTCQYLKTYEFLIYHLVGNL